MTQNMEIYIPLGQDHLLGPIRKKRRREVILKIMTETKLQKMKHFCPIFFNMHKNICFVLLQFGFEE